MSVLIRLVDISWFLLKKIVPRIIIILGISWVVKSFLYDAYLAYCYEANTETYWTIIFIFAFVVAGLTFYHFPPSVEAIYFLENTGIKDKDEAIFIELLKVSKDKISGIYKVENSFAIKSLFRTVANRNYFKLRTQYNFKNYEKFLHSKTKKEYESHYYMMMEIAYSKLTPYQRSQVKDTEWVVERKGR
jgi:hypothetical protein